MHLISPNLAPPVGVFCLAPDAWSAEEGKKPLPKYLKESFDILRAELCRAKAVRFKIAHLDETFAVWPFQD